MSHMPRYLNPDQPAEGDDGSCVAITPASTSGTINDWAPVDAVSAVGLANAGIVRQVISAATTINGMTTGGACRTVEIYNLLSIYDMIIPHEALGSVDIHRFALPWGTTMAIAPGASVRFRYDTTATRWYPLNIDYASITDTGTVITALKKIEGVSARFIVSDSTNPDTVLVANFTGTGRTTDKYSLEGAVQGSFDATAGNVASCANIGVAQATRSAGANTVLNIAYRPFVTAGGAGVTDYSWYSPDAAGAFYQLGAAKFGGNIGFYGTTPVVKGAVTGAGNTAALTSLISKLVATGIISSTATPSSDSTPTTEYIVAASGAISPTIDVTFIDVNNPAPAYTLADGTVDGFIKTICSKCFDGFAVITPANFRNGTALTAAGAQQGGFQLVWDADHSSWRLPNTPLNYTF